MDRNLDLTSFCRTVDYHLRTGLTIKSLQLHIDVRKFWQVGRKMNTFSAIFVSAILWCSRICQNHRLWPWPVQPFWTWLWNWIGLKGPWEWRIDCGIDWEHSGMDWKKDFDLILDFTELWFLLNLQVIFGEIAWYSAKCRILCNYRTFCFILLFCRIFCRSGAEYSSSA